MTLRVRLYAFIAATEHGTTVAAIMGERRDTATVQARWTIWRWLHDDGFSLAQIGRWTNRDHTSVIHGLRRLREIECGRRG